MFELNKRLKQMEDRIQELERLVASMQAALALSDDGRRVRRKGRDYAKAQEG